DENGTGAALFNNATSPTFGKSVILALGDKLRLEGGSGNENSVSASGTGAGTAGVTGGRVTTFPINVGGLPNATWNMGSGGFWSDTAGCSLGLSATPLGTAFLTDLTITNPVTVANGGTGRA